MSETKRTRKLTDDSQGEETGFVITNEGIKFDGEYVVTPEIMERTLIEAAEKPLSDYDYMTRKTLGVNMTITSGTIRTNRTK